MEGSRDAREQTGHIDQAEERSIEMIDGDGMTRVSVALVQVLAEFFLDQFAEDAAGVGDWLAQGGTDVDSFYTDVQALRKRSKEQK
jgi:hypothetical protein